MPALRSVPTVDLEPRQARIAAAIRGLAAALGLDLSDPDLAGSDGRAARVWEALLAGIRPGSEPRLETVPNPERHRGLVSVSGIPFHSLCAHHLLPFSGLAHLGYVPGEWLADPSELARAAGHLARRPQLQERLAEGIASWLEDRLAPAGVVVVLERRHSCMEIRGAATQGAVTTTTAVRGVCVDERVQESFLARIATAGARGGW